MILKIFNSHYSIGTDQSEWMLGIGWEKGPGGAGVPRITLISTQW